MTRLALFLCSSLLFSPTAVLADCADYWFTRNLIFDRVGYCFGSPLGQAIFDNRDCTTQSPVLAAPDKAAVARIRANEADAQCRINTQARSLGLPNIAFRKQVQTIPVPLPRNSALGCLTWRAGAVALHNGADHRFAVVGQLNPGDNIYFNHEQVGAFSFVSTEGAAGQQQGWVALPRLDLNVCSQIIP